MECSREETYQQIGKAGIILLLSTLGDKVLAVVKEMVTADRFGISSSLDVFNIAYAFPSIVVLFSSAAIISAFVPLYIEWSRLYPGQEADGRARALLLLTTGVFCLLAAAASILSPWIFPLFGRGFGPQDTSLGIALQRWLALLMLLDGAGTLLSGLLLARKKFVALNTAPIFINLSIIGFLMLREHFGIYALVWGFLTGTLCKVFYLGCLLRMSGFQLFSKPLFDPTAIRNFVVLSLPLLGSELIANMNLLVDQVMATQLPPGSVSTLRYAYRMNDLPIQLVVLALSKAIFPFISKKAIENDLEGLRDVYGRCLEFLAFLTLPIICLMTLFSQEFVSLLLQRGAFDENAAKLTSDTLRCYSYGLFFYGYTFVNGAFFSALRKTSSLFYMGCLSVLLNFCFNVLLMRFMGVQGIALSTTITLALVSSGFLVLLKTRLQFPSVTALFKGPRLMLTATIFMYTVGLFSKEGGKLLSCNHWMVLGFSVPVAFLSYLCFLRFFVWRDEWLATVALITSAWRRR